MSEEVRPASDDPRSGHVVVAGLEGLSVRTIEELDRMGEHAVVVASPVDARFRGPAERFGATVVEGSPHDPEVLARAGIPGARALILTSLDDVGNIHAALVARSLDPDIDLVIRVFDEDFGERLTALVPGAVALSASALAVPGFVSAVLGEDDAIAVDVLGRRLVVRHADPDDPGVLAQLADDRVEPVALFPPPGPGLLSLVDIGRADGDGPTTMRGSAMGRRQRIGQRLPAFDPRFRRLAILLGLLVIVSTLIFGFLAGVNPVDAVYNAVKAFFGGVDESVVSTPELRIFAIVLTLLGAAALATLYALIADAVLSSRLASILGTRVPDVSEHVIVAGVGTIGFRIAAELHRRGIMVLAAERQADSRFVTAARKMGITVITADARDPETLRTLHIDKAASLVAATDDDSVNLATALHARTQREDLRIVVRLFDPELAAHLDRALGKYHSRSVSALSAPAYAAAALGRDVLGTIPIGHRRIMVVARLEVEAGSPADGSTIAAEMAAAEQIDGGGARALALIDDGVVTWSPTPETVLRAGNGVIVVANRRGLANVLTRSTRHA